MAYSLKEAAEATGKTKPTILRAIQSGKISAKKDDHGEWEIDPAELHRVYPKEAEAGARNGAQRNSETHAETALRQEITLLREMLADRDRRVADKESVIDDLRNRLDAEAEERRRTQAQLTALLTDQREQQPATTKRRWWSFNRRG